VSVHDRATRQAQTRYTTAVLELARAMTAFNAADVPLDHGTAGQVEAWTADHVAVMRRCAQAWSTVVARRRELDLAIREAQRPVH
jgi:hypothetical protein